MPPTIEFKPIKKETGISEAYDVVAWSTFRMPEDRGWTLGRLEYSCAGWEFVPSFAPAWLPGMVRTVHLDVEQMEAILEFINARTSKAEVIAE